jgi:hypothetical protein
VSVDNGYSDMALANICTQNGLIYISVPKKSYTFCINGKKITLSEWIKEEFLRLEKEHETKQKDLPEVKKEAFIYRFKGYYRSKKVSVILLAFRLNSSKKVSIIYTTSKNEKAKILRRLWFFPRFRDRQRTYIEQFFKTLKHVLKIQESRTKDKNTFSFKFLRFAFIAIHVQQLVRCIRKKMKAWGKKGFISIQRIIRKEDDFHDLLQSKLLTII